ncbi:MAG: TraB/GumN family protein [Gammaproteobacteria bacterium]|nr:TraB/GumN family protein [Gammaproteobacteria bacterium]
MYLAYIRNIICLSIALFCFELSAESFVWHVSHGEHQLYIGGTSHLLPASEFPLPAEFYQAYKQAEKLVFEVDISKMNAPSINSLLMSFIKYQDGRTLNSVLSPESYLQLRNIAAELEVDINSLALFRPDFVVMQLVNAKLMQLGMAGEGVDDYFFNKGIKDRKSMGYLETPEQHLALMFSTSDGFEDEWVARNLDLLESLEEVTQKALAAWRSGNRKIFTEMAEEMTETKIGQIEYQLLLVERNKSWVEQIDSMVKSQEIEFILVGAMHLAGPSNVLDLLVERGFKVQQLNTINKPSSR